MPVDLQLQRLTPADQPVAAAVEPVHVGLEPVPQAGLGDVAAALQIPQQVLDAVAHVVVQTAHSRGHDAGQQQAAEAGGGLGRQPQVPERDAPGGGDGS